MINILDRLEGVRQTGPDRWLARCPAHDDKNPSLSVRDAGDKLLLHCFVGCDALDVVHAIGLELADLFSESPDPSKPSKPRRRRIPASDVLAAISHEVHVVAVIAADVLAHKEIDDETWDRLALAVARIGDARDCA